MKKLITVILIINLIFLVLAGCTGTTGGGNQVENNTTTAAVTEADNPIKPTGAPSVVTFTPGGEKTDRMREFVEKEIGPYLLDKFNITFNIEYMPWGETSEIRMASGEDIASFGEVDSMSRYKAKGYITDMTDYLQKFGPNLVQKMDPTSFKAFQLEGRQYGIPIGNKNNASEWYQVAVRQDLLEEAGMKEIHNIDDLEEFYTKCKDLHPDYVGFGEGSATEMFGPAKMMAYTISEKNVQWLDGYTFLDVNSDDDKVYSFLESEEFKKVVDISNKWQKMGIMSKQWMSDPASGSTKFEAGQGMFRSGNAGRPWEMFPTLNSNEPKARIVNYRLGDTTGRPRHSRGMYSTCFLISSSAKDPGAYIRVINDMYESQEIYDYWTYGIEGVDYELTENGRLAGKKNDGVVFQEWVTCHIDYMRWDEKLPQDYIDAYMKFNDGCVPQKDIGFAFNMDNVKDLYSQMEAVRTEYFTPMIVGLKSYEDGYDDAIRRMKEAGLDDYMAEFQKQFSEFYAKK